MPRQNIMMEGFAQVTGRSAQMRGLQLGVAFKCGSFVARISPILSVKLLGLFELTTLFCDVRQNANKIGISSVCQKIPQHLSGRLPSELFYQLENASTRCLVLLT